MTGPDFSKVRAIHRGDQQRAAEAHTARVVDRIRYALPGGGRMIEVGPAERPQWLTALFERHNAAVETDGQACDHIADGLAGPRCIAAWRPGVIVCAQCMAAGVLMPAKGSDAEFTCDGCGVVYRAGLRSAVIHVSADTMFVLGACPDCAPGLDGVTA